MNSHYIPLIFAWWFPLYAVEVVMPLLSGAQTLDFHWRRAQVPQVSLSVVRGKFIRFRLRYTKRYGKPLVSLGHDPLFGGFSIFLYCCRVTTNRFLSMGKPEKNIFGACQISLSGKHLTIPSWREHCRFNPPTGWWFQPFLFSIIYGMSSFPLTNMFQRGRSTTNQPIIFWSFNRTNSFQPVLGNEFPRIDHDPTSGFSRASGLPGFSVAHFTDPRNWYSFPLRSISLLGLQTEVPNLVMTFTGLAMENHHGPSIEIDGKNRTS